MRSGLGRLALGCAAVIAVIVVVTVVRRDEEAPASHRADHAALARDFVASGKHLLTQQRLPEAYAAFQDAVRLAPDLADGYRGLAAVAYDQGAVIEAVSHLRKVAELDHADGRPHRMIGHICADLDKREEAVAAYRQALDRSLTPMAEAEVRVELAEQLLKLGDADAALAMLPKDAGTAPALAVRAEATWTTAGADEAISLVESALKMLPDEPRLLSLMGRLHVDRGDYDKAVDPLERALALDQAELTTLQALATAQERLGRADDAARVRQRRADVQAALERLTSLTVDADAQPWNAAVREELSRICASLGKNDLAAMWRHAATQARAAATDRGQ
jgi:tetratricopeptide (TPR) repeat protein